jgi:hypothetical protein
MVKLLDPFTGYLLASGNNLLHFGYFIGILIMPQDTQPCSAADYQTARKLLIASHASVFTIQLIQYILTITDHVIFAHILDYAAVLFYQGSILYTQSQYFAHEKECSL